MTNRPDYIDGIFNYCDRWCERCDFTERCGLFAQQQALAQGRAIEAPMAADNVESWLEEGELDDEEMDEMWAADGEESDGVLDSDDPFEAIQAAERDETIKQDPMLLLARRYTSEAAPWLRGREDAIETWVDRKLTDANAAAIDDAISILCWYVFQIEVKLARAVEGVLDDEEENRFAASLEEEGDEARFDAFDADGLAKVALIGIERSIGAWTALRTLAPVLDTDYQRFLQSLARLRRATDERFPGARTFQRPGFDDPQNTNH